MGNTSSISEYSGLLIGRTDNGKSSSGNSILGDDHFFASFASSQACTKSVSKYQTQRWGIDLTVVDTPGLADPELDEIENVEFARNNMIKSFRLCPGGFNAILIVLSYKNRYNTEEKGVIDALTEIFGDKMFDSTILIFTHGDNFDEEQRVSETESKDSQTEFIKWCLEVNGELKKLLYKCGYRAVLYHNTEKYSNQRDLERQELFKNVKLLTKTKYTKSLFDKNEPRRKKLILNKYFHPLKAKITNELLELKNDLRLITHQPETVHSKATELLSKLGQENFPEQASLVPAVTNLRDNFKSFKQNREKFDFLIRILGDMKSPILQEISSFISVVNKILNPEKHKNELKLNVCSLLDYIKEQSIGTNLLKIEEQRVKMFLSEVESLETHISDVVTEIR